MASLTETKTSLVDNKEGKFSELKLMEEAAGKLFDSKVMKSGTMFNERSKSVLSPTVLSAYTPIKQS